jgi:transforming growth factor-beta-induced protein
MKTRITTKITTLFLMAFAVVILASCEKDQAEPIQQDNNLQDIPTTLKAIEPAKYGVNEAKKKAKKPSFDVLKVALAQTGLMSYVAQNELTLFAPTDDAFAAIGLNKQNIASVDGIEDILLYHVLEGRVYSGDLMNGFYPTLNGAAVEINLDNGVMVDDANVEFADITALNGVVHVIDAVIFPPTMNIVEIAIQAAQQTGEFETLVAAVVAAGLDGVLSGEGPFTVFAPTDAAFAELGLNPGNIASVPNLAEILTYHVLPGRIFSTDLTTGYFTTVNGGDIMINANSLTIADNGSDELANIVVPFVNIQGTNGVIHTIDKVLLP